MKTVQKQIENLDHLGLIAGIIDEIGLVEKINELLGEQPEEIVSPGHVVKAMILNGMGLVSSPLYLFGKFFEGKPTEHLLGKGIKAKHLNDDKLGRVLDKLYSCGLSELFTHISLLVLDKFKINVETLHLDSTSMSVEGNYKSMTGEVEENLPINITYGYSRDHRPDLKQFMMDLICSGDGDVPLFLRVASGNEADKAIFAQLLNDFKSQFNLDSLMVADSALYTEGNLQKIQSLFWLSRVPLTIKSAKKVVVEIKETAFSPTNIEGYRSCSIASDYGNIPQRWLVVESKKRRELELKTIEKNLEKSLINAQKKLKALENKSFDTEISALQAVSLISKQLKYHSLTNVEVKLNDDQKKNRGNKTKRTLKPTSGGSASSQTQTFSLAANLEVNWEKIETENQKAGRFILATNILNSSELSNDDMLVKYKEQQSAERGFGFLKDPLFFTSSVFLKSPKRIASLALIMGLCLLVYTLGQRSLRRNLEKHKTGIKNQLGKLTQSPTLRWVFQCFQAVHILVIDGVKEVINLTTERLFILKFFPQSCQKYYLMEN